jgi:phage-related protein
MGQAMDAAGTAAEQAAVRNQTFKFAFDSLKGSLETIQIIIGSALLPVLTDLINNTLIPGANAVMEFSQAFLTAFSEASEFTSTFSEQVGAAIDTLMGVTDSIGPFQQLGIAISDVGRWVGDNLTPILATLATAITGFVVPAIYAWAMAQWTTAIPAAIATVTAMLPFIATVLAIAAVVGLLVAAWTNNWGGIQEKTAAVWAVLQPILAQLWDWLGVQLVAAGVALAAFWTGTLWPALQVVGAFIMDTIVPVLAQLWDWLGVQLVAAGVALAAFWTGTLWPALQAVGAFITGTVIPAFSQIWTWLSTNIPAAIAAVVTAFNWVVTTVTEIVNAVVTGWNTVVTTTTTTWNSIVTTVMGYVTTIQTAIQTGLYVVTTIVQAIWNTIVLLTSIAWAAIMTAIQPVLDWFSTTIGPAITAVSDSVSAGWTALSGAAATAWSAVSSAVSTAWDAISGTVSTVAASVQGAVSTAWDAISGATSTAWDAVSTVVTSVTTALSGSVTSSWNEIQASTDSIWSQVETIITGVTTAIQTVVTTATDIIQTLVTGAWSVIVAASENDFGSISGIISGVWDDVKATFNTGVDDVKKVFKGLASDAVGLGKDIVDGIIKGVSNAGSALTNKLRDLAKGALDAAKAVLGIHSPSTVFADMVGTQIPAGVAKGIEQATPKAMGAMADMAGKLTGMIGSTTGAFASLAGAAQVPHSAMAQFADTMVDVIAMFNSVYQRVRGLMLSDALHFLGSANVIFDSVSKGADALGKLAGLGQISETAVDRFGTAMLAVILAFDSVAKVVRGLLLINAKFITADATAIFETVSKGADALVKLVGLGDVSAAAIGRFADGMRLVIVALAEVAGQMAGGGLAQAQTFAAGAGQVLATVGASVDALNKLNALGSAIPGIFLRFATYVRVLVNRMAEAAGEVSGQALEAAAAFAAGAGKVIGAVSNGVDAFTKLEGMGAAVPGMFLAFATYLRVLVDRMAEAAATVSQDALAAAVRFAEGAGKVIGVVASGVDAFTKLNTLGDAVPGIFLKFASYVMVLVNRMGEAAAGINAGALTAAVAFAEGAGKVVGIIGSAVDGFKKLADFQGVPQAAFVAFAYALDQAVTWIWNVSQDFTVKGVAAAAEFATGAGKTVGIIGGAVDGFTKLADFQGVPQAAFVAFANALDQAVTWIWNVSQDFTVKGVQAAAAFAESAGKTVAFIGAAVDGFTKLAEFQGVPLAAFVAFGYALDSAITWIWNVSQDFTVEGVAAAAAFAEGAGKTVGIIGSAVDGFAKLAVFEGVPQAAFAAFGAALRSALDALIAISAQFAAESVSAAAAFGEGAGKALAFIGNAVDSFGKLADMGRLSQGAVNAFSYNIVLVVSQLQQLARVFSVEALDAVGLFSAAVGRAVAGLGAAGDSLMKLADTTRLKPDAVNAWSFNVVLVVAQLQQLARVFTTEALAAAATFAAGVAAVAQSVKAALDALATLAGAKQLRGDVLAAFIAAAQALVAQMAAYLPPNAETIGANTITGLINGIVGQRAALITAMVATVMAAVTAAQQALGIASPSTVFEALGQFSGAGMISGMERMVPAVAGAGATLGAAASRGAAGVAAGGGGGGGGGTTVNVTIASGAIVLSSGAGGKLSDADLRRLAALIGQEIATQAGGRR